MKDALIVVGAALGVLASMAIALLLYGAIFGFIGAGAYWAFRFITGA